MAEKRKYSNMNERELFTRLVVYLFTQFVYLSGAMNRLRNAQKEHAEQRADDAEWKAKEAKEQEQKAREEANKKLEELAIMAQKEAEEVP